MCSCFKTSSSSSSRLVLFMIPVLVLVVVVVVVGVFGTGVKGSSNWMFASSFHPWIWPSVVKRTSFSGNVTKSSNVITEDPKERADFRPELPSSPPPLPDIVEQIQITTEQAVSNLLCFLLDTYSVFVCLYLSFCIT